MLVVALTRFSVELRMELTAYDIYQKNPIHFIEDLSSFRKLIFILLFIPLMSSFSSLQNKINISQNVYHLNQKKRSAQTNSKSRVKCENIAYKIYFCTKWNFVTNCCARHLSTHSPNVSVWIAWTPPTNVKQLFCSVHAFNFKRSFAHTTHMPLYPSQYKSFNKIVSKLE